MPADASIARPDGSPTPESHAGAALRFVDDDPDRDLLRAVLEEHPHGTRWFTELVTCHWDRAWRLCQALLLNERDAEEATKDAFIKVHRQLPSFRFESRFTAWLDPIICETALHLLAARQPDRAAWARRLGLPLPLGQWTLRQLLDPAKRKLNPRQALGMLRAMDRLLLVLRELEEAPHEATAAALRITPQVAQTRTRDARIQFRRLLPREAPAARSAAAGHDQDDAGSLRDAEAALLRQALGRPSREQIVRAMDDVERQVALEDLILLMVDSVTETVQAVFHTVVQLEPAIEDVKAAAVIGGGDR